MVQISDEYKTGNRKMDALIQKALAKVSVGKVLPVPKEYFEEKRGKFTVANKDNRTSFDKIVFDSQQEKERYEQLLLLQKAGKIAGLEIQKQFELLGDFVREGKAYKGVSYIADFYYEDLEVSRLVVEECKVKATRTKDYIVKMKWFLSRYPHILFREILGDSRAVGE